MNALYWRLVSALGPVDGAFAFLLIVIVGMAVLFWAAERLHEGLGWWK